MFADWLCMMQGDECLKQFGAYVFLIKSKDKFEGHAGALEILRFLLGNTVTLAAPIASAVRLICWAFPVMALLSSGNFQKLLEAKFIRQRLCCR